MLASVRALALGVTAGMTASAVQAAVGKSYDRLLLPPGEDSDLAPRLVHRIAEEAGEHASRAEAWSAGTLFHFGYGAFWGAAYAAARERWAVPPLVGGALLAGGIYAITFPPWGGAVQTGTVRPPGRRSSRMTGFAAAATLSFGLTTALAYEALRVDDDEADDHAGGGG